MPGRGFRRWPVFRVDGDPYHADDSDSGVDIERNGSDKLMDDLIEALKIFRECMGEDVRCPTHCEHDVLYVDCRPELVSLGSAQRLDQLGFIRGSEEDGTENGFISFRFGSC